MAAARKTMRKIAPSKTRARYKSDDRHSVQSTLPSSNAIPSAALHSEPPSFLIVGIGASAGGLEAMEEFFRRMSPSSDFCRMQNTLAEFSWPWKMTGRGEAGKSEGDV